MSIHHKKGVIFFLLLHLSCSMLTDNKPEEERYFDEEDYEYEDYPDDEDDGVIRSIPGEEEYKRNITTPIKLPNEFTTSSDVTLPMIPISASNCPESCYCDEDYEFINCSNRSLTNVPGNIPKRVKMIDLRYNLISNLDATDFLNCSRLREINLSGNKISNIKKEMFSHVRKLEYINLENNALTTIDPSTFSENLALEKINLNNNPIELSENNSFLNQPNLKVLFLRNCSLTHLYDETFKNLTSLSSLELSYNNFGMSINPNAFEPLKNLTSLTLPTIERQHFKSLCEVLPSIDVINTKDFNVSCFELVSGSTFEEIITEGKNTSLNIPKSNRLNRTNTKEKIATTLSEPTILELSEETGAVYTNGIAKNDTSNETYQVAVSSETINHILIVIIIIAIVGLAIGMLCRKDICGIKTKLCRTRRPPTTDQVRPAEEVPLNKV